MMGLADSRQIRLDGTAKLITDGNRKKAVWHGSRQHTRQIYQSSIAPGTPIDSPRQAQAIAAKGSDFEHFCLVEVTITQFEWLDVSEAVHQKSIVQATRRGLAA